MCFNKTSHDQQPQVAVEDIKCFKYLYKEELRSPMNYHIWKEKEINTTEIVEKDGGIEDGFHACKTQEDVKEYIDDVECREDRERYAIYKFKIPKGATYYENRSQYVSDKMVMVSKKPVYEFPELINE